jgi:hypothetical protein
MSPIPTNEFLKTVLDVSTDVEQLHTES